MKHSKDEESESSSDVSDSEEEEESEGGKEGSSKDIPAQGLKRSNPFFKPGKTSM
jgi:hypothetical protein